ncbi:MAG: CvpA family protein [Alphaproteobacteria bacterium]
MGLFIDIFVVLVLLASVGIAFVRGFIREVLTIFGIVGGIAAAYVGGPLLSSTTRGWLGVEEGAENPEKLFDLVPYSMLAEVLAYGIILIVVVLILSIISHFIAEFVKNIGLGALDRTLGVVFGIARALLVLGLIYLPFYYAATDEQKAEWFSESKSQVYLEATSKWMSGFLPEDVEDKMEAGVEKVEEASEMRKKVEELGVLGSPEDKSSDKDQPDLKKNDGYSDSFRNQMDELIENQVDRSGSNLNE